MIEPDFLDELERFEASLSHLADSHRRGEQQSRRVGEGLTFSDYRNYAPGDDTRLVDWKLYARTGELFVKQFESERNLTVHVLLDASASMDFGGETDRTESTGETANKFEYAAKLGLGFCALAAEENNDFRVSVFGEEFDRLDTGASSRGEILRTIELLNDTTPGGEADFERVLESYAATIDSRSLVFVGSDFLADVDVIETGLDALSKNDLVLAHVVAPEERDPPTRTDTIFRGVERALSIRTYFGSRQRSAYQQRLREHLDAVEGAAHRLQASHVRVDTDRDFFDAFAEAWVE
ncbi:DUF58 domain-containing protein [Haloarculaceae archaeon H-GB2-1]|nr:DUF58 domain-containing protein [Haloarculaceae archaeon H-GB1-1]MEA5385830.1 DUF58 domain-containing protein [Haloarculaceae archaeon H-GB11]MEA5407331.1 DUF58 domain-containing protein [Haloarculaceae archaeon H-GB2-1]